MTSQITNESFLKSWLTFNIGYYPAIANILLSQFQEGDKNAKYIAIELLKLVSEEIESIAMWIEVLHKVAEKPQEKIYEIYCRQFIKEKDFDELAKKLEKMSPNEFRGYFGISRELELDETKGITNNLIDEIIKNVRELIYYGKVNNDGSLLHIFHKIKHGMVAYCSETTKPNGIEFLLGMLPSGLFDTPFFEASEELVKIMHRSITEVCTPILISIIKLKYADEKHRKSF
jgi:hypothetical protein